MAGIRGFGGSGFFQKYCGMTIFGNLDCDLEGSSGFTGSGPDGLCSVAYFREPWVLA